MARTVVGVNDPKAVKRWSGALAVAIARDSYFTRTMIGRGEMPQTPLWNLEHLENDAGDNIKYDLSLQMKMQPVEGDDTLENNEEPLRFATDEIYIDQMRAGVNTGGRMTRKRTLHDLRRVARARQAEWWSRIFDELLFMYLSGARGTNVDYILRTGYPGFAGNSLQAPDATHLLYGGAATSKISLVAADKFNLKLIDRACAKASSMGGGSDDEVRLQPCRINGDDHYVVVMNPFQVYDVRTDTNPGQWIDIQKAAAGATGHNNPLFRGSLGMYNKTILHEHNAVVKFTDYGSGSNIAAARALFLARQAGVICFGSPGTGMRFDWHEETADRGNQVVITTSSIFGIKKTRFNSKDFGILSLDTAAADPNP